VKQVFSVYLADHLFTLAVLLADSIWRDNRKSR